MSIRERERGGVCVRVCVKKEACRPCDRFLE